MTATSGPARITKTSKTYRDSTTDTVKVIRGIPLYWSKGLGWVTIPEDDE